jgi:uncharacterized protein
MCLTSTFAFSATPLVNKGGTCPDLTKLRETPTDDWDRTTAGGWQAVPNPASTFPRGTIQKNITPEESINCIQTPPGLVAETWASEKSVGGIAYPQHFTFDERGRMWLVEPRSYPNIIRTASGTITDQKFVGGQDRILILEDTDGDRVMDKVTVFKSGLNMPQSIEMVKGGVVVSMVPYVVFFPNNNDTAGTPQILWSGMGGGNGNYDTHSGISSFIYGLDNWIYGIDGWGSCNAEGVNCGQGKVYRFRHPAIGFSKKEFELWSSEGPYNAWGVGVMEDGQIFQSGATGTPHINHSIRKGQPAIDIRTDPSNESDKNKFYPITGDRYYAEGSTSKNSKGWFNSGTTAVSGMHFYTSRLFPKKYWNRFAFNCEGASKLCNQDSLVVSTNGTNTGSTWRAVRMPGPDRSNLIASTDAWVAPILAKTGPDGAVWVLDWNNYLFIHNPLTPKGPGEAWNNKLRVKDSYRIYRITPEDGSREPVLNLTTATVPQLVATLSNPNFLWRMHAQRQLIWKGFTAEMGTLLEGILTKSRIVDDVGNDPAVTHAIWTLSGLGQFEATGNPTKWDPILKSLLLHPAWCVRENALKAMPRTAASAQSISDNCSVNDSHGHVRLQAMVAWSEISAKPANPTAMWSTYQNVDAYSKTAFTDAKLTSAATLPCEPKYDPAVSIQHSSMGKLAQPRSDLQFTVQGNGFTIHNNQQLNSGVLFVFDPNGHLVFQSTYDAAQKKWSQPKAEGLRAPVYLYLYRGTKGDLLKGTFSLAASL